MNRTETTPFLVAAASTALALGLLAAGCSAQAPAPARTPEPSYPASPTSEATAAEPGYPALGGPTDLATAEADVDAAEMQLLSALDDKTVRGEPLDASTDRCTVVCRALASMQRSVKHVCDLATDRCEAATERLKAAEERAKTACPSCATPT